MTTKIVLEGIDGAGKSTVIKKLKSYLEDRGKSALIVDKHNLAFADPADNERARVLRDVIWRIQKNVTEQNRGKDAYFKFLVIASWYHLVSGYITEKNAAMPYDFVLIDGWYHRHVIKTSLRSNHPIDVLLKIVEPLTTEVPIDFYVFLDVPPEEASTRKTFSEHECGALDGLEQLGKLNGFVEYQSRIRNAFCSNFPHFHCIANDRSRSPEKTAEDIFTILNVSRERTSSFKKPDSKSSK